MRIANLTKLAAVALLLLNAAPAHAQQYFGNYMANRFLMGGYRGYGIFGSFGGGVPLYYASNLINAGLYLKQYGRFGPQLTTQRQEADQDKKQSRQQDDEDPSQVSRRHHTNDPWASSQSVQARFANNPQQAQQQAGPFAQPAWNPAAAPPAAPQQFQPEILPIPPMAEGAQNLSTAGPLASGFIDLVNNKFSGNIGKALKDPEAKSWARSLGINTDNSVTGHRSELIKNVLQDGSIDSLTKVETITALMHRS